MKTGRLGTEAPKNPQDRGVPRVILQLESLVGKRGTRRNRVLRKRVGSSASRLTRKHANRRGQCNWCVIIGMSKSSVTKLNEIRREKPRGDPTNYGDL